MQSFEYLNLKTCFVTLSQKSSLQLSIDGYFFCISGDAKAAKVNWRCIKTNLYCKAKCYTLGCNIGSEYTIYFNDDDDQQHSHGPDTTGCFKANFYFSSVNALELIDKSDSAQLNSQAIQISSSNKLIDSPDVSPLIGTNANPLLP
ncbi:unnamed protein product [Brachionus calyciflorus]|uniref:FLYWCH-type domain-containing protein n=1 Tax=Brachionus calyciflorus TaxID=104777 RepID=A0A814EP52_9BILA|nr:unnamed protein product [Brachionus calyciflorus]